MYELMKPTPYLGTFPYPLVSWKGQTLKQITSSLQENGQVNADVNISSRNLMLPAPLKLYPVSYTHLTLPTIYSV